MWFKPDNCPQPQVPILKEQTAEKKAEEHTVTIKTQTKKPDGTLTTEIKTDKISSKENSKRDVKNDVSKERYVLGLEYLPSLTTLPSARDIEINGSARLGNSPFWLQGGYDLKHNQFKVGLSYSW
jgi:CRISPR/Cas system-associated protein Cas5 (RAMP superfamily)